MQAAAHIAKQSMAIQKVCLANAFEAQALGQAQNERTTRAILDGADGMPPAVRRLCACWTADLKNGQATFESLLKAHFDMIDGILARRGTLP